MPGTTRVDLPGTIDEALAREEKGPRFSEAKAPALANAFEKATEWHARRPKLSLDMPVPSVKRKDGGGAGA